MNRSVIVYVNGWKSFTPFDKSHGVYFIDVVYLFFTVLLGSWIVRRDR